MPQSQGVPTTPDDRSPTGTGAIPADVVSTIVFVFIVVFVVVIVFVVIVGAPPLGRVPIVPQRIGPAETGFVRRSAIGNVNPSSMTRRR